MREIINMIVVLSLICAASGAILVNIKEATKDKIEQQVLTYVQGPTITSVLANRDNDPIKDRATIKGVTVFPAKKDGQLVGVAIEAAAPGYSGDVGVMVGFNIKNDTLLGIGITTQSETPGVGTRVMKPDFTGQFKGHNLEKMDLTLRGGSIDGVSGATYSSTGAVNAVAKAIKIYKDIKPQLLSTWKAS